MRNKYKRKKHQQLVVRSWLAAAVVVAGGLGLVTQASSNLLVHARANPRRGAVILSAPSVINAAATVNTPLPTPPPTAAQKPRPRVAYVPRALPAVTPAPNSNVSGLVPLAATPPPAAPASSAPSPTPGQVVLPPATPTYASYNWAGYMSPGGNFTGVKGSWTVPAVTGNGASTTADSAWIGIGGVTSGDLIQVGTDEFVSRGGQVSYEAFYEMLPDASTNVPAMTVAAGDVMSAEISRVSGTDWQISITDISRHETFTIPVTYSSSLSSAEWIEEDPSYTSGRLVPFDNFGTINFTGATATQNGTDETLGAAGGQAIVLVNGAGQAVASPTVVGSDGASFSVIHN